MDTRHIGRLEIVVALLLTASLLLESCATAPTGEAADSRQDARMLVLAIHSVALGEEDSETAGLLPRMPGVWLRPTTLPEKGPIDEVKAAIRELEAECARERAAIQDTLPEADMGEAVAALDQVCQTELARLQSALAELRAARKKSWFRRTVGGRILAWVWQRAKKNAPLIILGWATGGGEVAKHLLIERGRRDLQREARTAIGRALARKGVAPELLASLNLSPGEWPPKKPGRGGPVASSQAEESGQAPAGLEELFSPDSFLLPADGLWTAVCRHRYPEDWKIEWTMPMNLMARVFNSRATWTRSKVEQGGWLYSTELTHEGVGEITEDGMLQGPYHETTTLTWTQEGVTGGPQVTEYDGRMYGVISADMTKICLSRGENPGAYDIDYIRRIGREAFFGPDAGCEAECTITKEP